MRSLLLVSLLVALALSQVTVTVITGDTSQTSFVGDLVLEATATIRARFDTPITVTGRATINGKLELITRRALTNFVVLRAAATQGSFTTLVGIPECDPNNVIVTMPPAAQVTYIGGAVTLPSVTMSSECPAVVSATVVGIVVGVIGGVLLIAIIIAVIVRWRKNQAPPKPSPSARPAEGYVSM